MVWYDMICKLDRGSRSGSGGTSLGEVRTHVTLEVEVGEGLVLANLEKTRELGIGVNLAAVRLVLKVVFADILVDITSHVSAGHLGASGLGEELGELVADASGLDEAAGGAGAGLALALGVGLLGNSQGAGPLLLESAILGLEGGEESTHLLKLGEELARLGNKSTVNLGDGGGSLLGGRCGGVSGSLGSSLGGVRGDGGGLGLGGLLGGGLSRCLSGGGLGLGLSRLGSYHLIMYTNIYFLSGLTH